MNSRSKTIHVMANVHSSASWLDNRSLKLKAIGVLGTLFGLFALTATLFLLNQREVESAQRASAHTVTVLQAANEMMLAAVLQQSATRGYALTGQARFLAPYEGAQRDFDHHYTALRRLTADNPEQQARLTDIRALMEAWTREFVNPMVALASDPAGRDELVALVQAGRGKQLMDEVRAQGLAFVTAEEALLAARGARLSDGLDKIRHLAIGLLLAAALLTAIFLVAIQRSLVTPMNQLTGLIGRLTGGELDVSVPHLARKDELGAIAAALESFRQASLQVQQREWIKTHTSAMAQRLSRAANFSRFGSELLDYLCPLLGSGSGALYRVDADPTALARIGAYGQVKSDSGGPGDGGEGLVAQCAHSQQPIVLEPVPASYFGRIQSGLGAATPTVVLLWPLPGLDGVVGVIELAGFRTLTPIQRELMGQVAQLSGLALEALSSAAKTRDLLEETQAQAEELQASEEALRVQQEELRSTNESLEGKNQALEEASQRLRASEEELRIQAEELRTTNDALNEKSRSLNEFNERLMAFQGELEAKNRELEQASRYKSEFLANMSHELRTPLNSLLILAKDLADNRESTLNAEQVESAQIIFDSGNSLLRLINDILDLSKIEAGRMEAEWEDVALSDIAAAIERQFRPVARERGIGLSVTLDPSAPQQIRSDSTKLLQILTNLVGNAVKFTHEGEVRLTLSSADDSLVPIGADPSQWIALEVADTGIGISEDKLARLFQAFEQGDGTTSRRYGGTGLGLSISRGLARMLHGDVRVSSTLGSGSRFTVVLPCDGKPSAVAAPLAIEPAIEVAPASSTASPTVTEPVVTPATAPAGSAKPPVPQLADDRDLLKDGDIRVLVIEDDLAFSRILVDMVRRKGYRVLAAADGETGLELAGRYQPNGILLDVNLPGMDGWTVIEKLKAKSATQHIPVHFITAADDAQRGLSMGAVGFVTKPATRASIDAALARVLQPSTRAGQRILVVDDDHGARTAVARLLRQPGVELLEAPSIAAGLAAVGEQTFDCIVLDLMLPDGTGFDFLDRVARLGPVPPVVVYSARELTREESLRLREYTDSIVIKGSQSPSRLLDEVSLFLHAVRRPASGVTPTAAAPSDLSGREVLLVDDDMRNVFALSKALRAHGLTVVAAQDGRKALTQLEQHPQVDWVLMDIMMPEMDGYETTREIRKNPRWAELPIIALTAKAMKGDREKCLAAGASDYLSKPIDVDKLLSVMRAWARPR